MNEYKFKKYIYENPDILGEPFTISRKKAEKIYEKGFPSAAEIIEGAKKKYPDANWSEYETILNQKAAAQVKRKKMPRMAARYRVAAACIALLLSYFTLVPSGRALASEIIQFIVKLYENVMVVTLPKDDHLIIPPDTTERFNSAAEFEAKTGLHPIVIAGDGLKVDNMEYSIDEYDIHYFTINYTSDAGGFWTRQEWNHAPIEYHQYTENSGYSDISLTDEYSLYYDKIEINGDIYTGLILPDSILHCVTLDNAKYDLYVAALTQWLTHNTYIVTDRFPNSRSTSPLVITYDNFDDVFDATGFKPFYFDADGLRLEEIKLEEGNLKTKTLRSYYLDDAGNRVYVVQTWGFKGGEQSSYHSITDFQEIDIGGTYTAYVAYDPIDYERSGEIFLKDSKLTFAVNDEAAFNRLLNILNEKESLNILNNSMYIS